MTDNASLVKEVIDWAVAHSLLMQTKSDGLFEHAPMSLGPIPFPQQQYIKAIELAAPFNTLVENISQQPDWLLETLATVEHEDEFTARLMSLLREVRATGGEKQPIHLGINRSDYMINLSREEKSVGILQVELNTIASSFGSLSSKVTSMHKYTLKQNIPKVLGTLPGNESLKSIAHALCFAHHEYLKVKKVNDKEELNAMWSKLGVHKPSSSSAILSGHAQTHDIKILFVVQPNERNVMDQRLLEYEIANQSSSDRQPLGSSSEGGGTISCIRASLAEIDSRCFVTSNDTLFFDNNEISVVYFRAGYTPDDYPTEKEWSGRFKVEHSHAVKCPCVAYHLAGTKKVQQKLAEPGQVEKFVNNPQDATALRQVFAGLYSLDELDNDDPAVNAAGKQAVFDAIQKPDRFVLKPQREGGGNNFFGQTMVHQLKTMPKKELGSYILMDRIIPPTSRNSLLRSGKIIEGDCLCELGLYSVYVGNGSKQLNEPAGHLLRAKFLGTDEGGVASGFACLSSPLLVDDSYFLTDMTDNTSASSSQASASSALPVMKRQRSDGDPNAI